MRTHASLTPVLGLAGIVALGLAGCGSSSEPSDNPCQGKKPIEGFEPRPCLDGGEVSEHVKEQAGGNVTAGYQGEMDAGDRMPINMSFIEAGLCPVNVHWHLGTEHLSLGQFDDQGTGPNIDAEEDVGGEAHSRRMAANAQRGYRCHHYVDTDAKFTTEYEWQHCEGMHVGETYEVHWPHSKLGACGTPHQYQSPFYDGVFCKLGEVDFEHTWTAIGVQSQVYTIVNDENYSFPDLIRGMIVNGEYGSDVAKYTGSTTGSSVNNEVCSGYAPITWQVDRTCHLLSASSFDKMCADMKNQKDDMSLDLHAHGSRVLVDDQLAADNIQRRLLHV